MITVDYLIPLAAQTLAPAIAQMAEALSKPSATTVDSMLALVTHTGVSRNAGSVMLESAGSDGRAVQQGRRRRLAGQQDVAMATASWASL